MRAAARAVLIAFNAAGASAARASIVRDTVASEALSNKEVAAPCWISPRTVAFHLRNAFTKTGVTSRGELGQLHLSRSVAPVPAMEKVQES